MEGDSNEILSSISEAGHVDNIYRDILLMSSPDNFSVQSEGG